MKNWAEGRTYPSFSSVCIFGENLVQFEVEIRTGILPFVQSKQYNGYTMDTSIGSQDNQKRKMFSSECPYMR